MALSNEIYRMYGGENDKSTFKLSERSYAATDAAYKDKKASFLKRNLDTVFICEAYSMETGVYYGTLFNNEGKINYEFHKGNFKSMESSFFSDRTLSLISKWDTLQIRQEEKKQIKFIGDDVMATGIKCYKKGERWFIEKIYFRDIQPL